MERKILIEKVADLLNISRRNYTDTRFKKKGLERIAIEVGAPFSDMRKSKLIREINIKVDLDENNLPEYKLSYAVLKYLRNNAEAEHSQAFKES